MSEDHNVELYSEKSESEHEVEENPVEDESLERREERQKKIDRMTADLTVPKSQSRKYLEKNEPAEYEKKREKYERFLKYRGRIGALTKELLNDYSISGNSMEIGNSDIQELFAALVEKSISFFEMKEWSSEHSESEPGDAEDDILFGNIYKPFDSDITTKPIVQRNPPVPPSKMYSAPFANHYRPGNSFWGKNIEKR